MIKLIALIPVMLATVVAAETIGDVDTAFKLIGPDHKIVVEAYDDPAVSGVTSANSGALGHWLLRAAAAAAQPDA